MTIAFQPGLYMRVQELEGGPTPRPLQQGFNTHTAYLALALHSASETSDAYFVFSNDRDETWFICTRHLRTVALQPGATEFRQPLESFNVEPKNAELRTIRAVSTV